MAAKGRRSGRFSALAAGACWFVGLLAPVAAAEPPADEASDMFRADRVAVIDLGLPQASIDALEADPDEYVTGSFSFAYADGPSEVGSTVASLPEVGIRLKGGAFGSFRPLTGKAAFKVKFNEFVKQRFLGLKKLTLNNMVQDPSMLHEMLAYRVFRAADVPSSRTGYAYVWVNGENFGLYANVETLDDVGLERWFGEFDDPQHLYEGEYATDVTPGGAGDYSVDEGDEGDLGDLEALIAAVNVAGAPFGDRVAAYADLEEMTRMWAVEKYVGQWDGYAGAGPSLLPLNELPNNYYLFSDAAGRFQMLPWGTDQAWGKRIAFDGEAGLLFDECLADSACWRLYREALVAVGQVVEPLGLSTLAAQTAALLAPWQALSPSREESGAIEIEEEVEGTRHFIVDRPGELDEWLAAHPSSVAGSPPAPAATATSVDAPLSATIGLARPLRIRRVDVSERRLIAEFAVHSAGRVELSATTRTAEGKDKVCTSRSSVPEAVSVTLRCELPQAIRKRRRERWLKFDVVIRFKPSGGTPEAVSRRIHAPRLDPG